MALKAFSSVNSKAIREGDVFGYWELAASDTAQPLLIPRFNDKSIHMFGTWGGATVALLGGNDPALAAFEAIYDFEGTPISQTADHTPWVILPNVYAIKPTITGGDGTTLIKVAIIGRGGN